MYCLGMSAVVLSFFLPESPKYLISRNKIKEAIDSFNYIAKFNRSSNKISDDATIVLDKEDHKSNTR
jgi:hypothetical protein